MSDPLIKDPVHEENGGWYFWDETWADRYGPYPSSEIAHQMLGYYANWLDTGQMDPNFNEAIHSNAPTNP